MQQNRPYKRAADLTPSRLPEPRHGGSVRLTLLAILAVASLCASGWWLTRAPEEKATLREQAAARADSFLAGTPFARLADLLRPSPAPLPREVIHPRTNPGTLAGTEISATIAAPMDFGAPVQGQAGQEDGQGEIFSTAPGQEVIFSQEPVAQVSEDSRIRPGYVTGLAQWLASRYRPGATGGGIRTSVQALNQEAGGKLASFAEGGRAGLLRYAFHPAMIEGLYALYGSRFLDELNSAAMSRGLTPSQNQQFHRSVAGEAAILASCLDGLLRVPALSARLEKIDSLAQKAVDANADLTTAVFELDELRSAKAGQQSVRTAQMRVDGATSRYRRASEEHDRAQTSLASEIRKYSGQNLDEESLLFLAAWVGRRYAAGGQAKDALKSCIAVLRDLSVRCAKAGVVD